MTRRPRSPSTIESQTGSLTPALATFLLARSGAALASGRPADAYRDAMNAGRLAETMGTRNPIILPWRSRAALALVALGRAAEASPIAEDALAICIAAGIPSTIGEARRVLAAASERERASELLHDAVTELEAGPAPLELACALIDLGAALRRAGRRREAREPLSRGLDIAHRHGAEPLTVAARPELRAAGGRPRREMRTGVDALTPSERRVADLATANVTDAQIPARLFITPKTTEHRLAATYRKLGITSRRELGALLNDRR